MTRLVNATRTARAIAATPHRRGTLNRQRILHVASEQFQRKGYDRTSLEDVARALAVTKPTLYYHFDSKEDILLGCVTEACDRLDQGLAAAYAPAMTGRQRLEVFLREYLRVITDNFGVSLVLSDDRVMSERGRDEYFARRKKINRHVTDIVAEGMRDGSIAPGDVTLTVYAVFGMFNHVTRWKAAKPRISLEAIHDRFCAILFDGVGAPRVPPGPPTPRAARVGRRRG